VVCLGGLSVGLLSRPAVAQPPSGDDPLGRPAPKLQPPGRPDLERRVAELEKQVARLTKEVAELRGRPKAKAEGEGPTGGPTAKPIEPLPDAAETNLFHLKNANAADVARVLGEVLGKERCVVAVDPARNALVVRGRPTDLKTVEALLKNLDAEAPKPPRQVKTFALKGKDAQEVAQALTKVLDSTTARVTAVGPSTVLVYGSPEELFLAAEVIKQIQDAAKQSRPDRDMPDGPGRP
jgi:type II secretory pathway component GspD/PulD (secretin)